MSVSKIMAQLLALPANRSCADCRVTLVDASQVYASYTPVQNNPDHDDGDDLTVVNKPDVLEHTKSFRNYHHQFAPPGYQPSFHKDGDNEDEDNDDDDDDDEKNIIRDPALLIRQRGLGHGVFVCAMCGAAHKLLQTGICQVHAVQDPMAWNADNVQQLVDTGNAHCKTIFEAYMPDKWNRIFRPRGGATTASTTGIAERLVFCRAKYEALAFCLPRTGPLAEQAWQKILDLKPKEYKQFMGTQTTKLTELELHPQHALDSPREASLTSPSGQLTLPNASAHFSDAHSLTSRVAVLPNRLVDFFCVVSVGQEPTLDHKFLQRSPAKKHDDNDFVFLPKVTDCYPSPNSYSDMEFPEHVGSFVFPEGCRSSTHAESPIFFTFVLTCADGSRLYGGALKLHDKTMDVEALQKLMTEQKQKMHQHPQIAQRPLHKSSKNVSGNSNKSKDLSSNPLPMSDEQDTTTKTNTDSLPHVSDIRYLPKVLVVLSHYPFFDLWRKFLLHIYRIALVEAPLPMERFIANFVSEVPLPPPGKISVRFGFTSHEIWTIQRPPDNELPMADFSFRPLFATLSISSVLVVMGCLLQETRVALVSKQYALLTPVAEALLSFLFPFHWHGMYIPVMPYSMLDILDAPMPFLVGLHSRYLQDTPASRRPHGVVFVDLDQDIIHLGWSDEYGPSTVKQTRRTPALPEREAIKLKNRLAACAASAYILPESGKAGSLTCGNGKALPFGERDLYCHISSAEIPTRTIRRKEFFANVDRAYGENEMHLSPEDFLTGQGLFHEKQERVMSPEEPKRTSNYLRRFISPKLSMGALEDSTDLLGAPPTVSASLSPSGSHLLEARDPKGFSVSEVRNAFLRFLVGIFKGYREFIDDTDDFRTEDFLASLKLEPRQQGYVEAITKTQMFERFIQERIENPSDPEVMFFDVTIDAKQNRFRKAPLKMLRNGGFKTDTSFLDDKSKQVTEKFTPPPPSHMGLPDDGRTYHYGSFPELDPTLFGKVRAPITWPEYQCRGTIRDKLRTSADMLRKQQTIVEGLLRASAGSSSLVLRKMGPNTLERALYALSRRFVVSEPENKTGADKETFGSSHGPKRRSSSVVSFSPIPTEAIDEPPTDVAEQIVFNARRKTCILVGIYMCAQVQYRAHLARKVHVPPSPLDPKSIINSTERTEYYTPNSPADSIEDHERSIISFQSIVRGRLAQKYKRQKIEAATKIEAWIRSHLQRKQYLCVVHGVLLLQARARARIISLAYLLLRLVVSKVQGRVRGFLVRRNMRTVIRGRIDLYRRQIFTLWKRSHTSLAYRTNFWTLIRNPTFLHHNLAAEELQRLWNELQLLQDTKLYSPDTLSKKASKLCLSNETYAVYLNLDKSLDVDVQEDFSQASSRGFSISSRSISFASSSEDTDNFRGSTAGLPFTITSERTQIYERMSQAVKFGHEDMSKQFDKFHIGVKDKKRKKSLAEAVWRNIDQANESCAVMYQFFPELKYSDTLGSTEPTRKGIRRSQFDFKPFQQDTALRARKQLDDRIRRNVALAASEAFCKVPDMYVLVWAEREAVPRRRLKASMSARGFKEWHDCHLFFMRQLVKNNLLPPAKPHAFGRAGSRWRSMGVDGHSDGTESDITLDALEKSLREDMAKVEGEAIVHPFDEKQQGYVAGRCQTCEETGIILENDADVKMKLFEETEKGPNTLMNIHEESESEPNTADGTEQVDKPSLLAQNETEQEAEGNVTNPFEEQNGIPRSSRLGMNPFDEDQKVAKDTALSASTNPFD